MKEYHAHIAHPRADKAGFSICGKRIDGTFHFLSIDHAFLAIPVSRLQPCPECVAAVVAVFWDAE